MGLCQSDVGDYWVIIMARNNRKKARLRILKEIKNQLIVQAERWGKTDYYTPLLLEEMELDQADYIVSNFLSEKSNLEYEINLLGVDHQELLIKLEKLDGYIKKAKKIIGKHNINIEKILSKLIGDKDKVKLALASMKPENNISVLLNSN